LQDKETDYDEMEQWLKQQEEAEQASKGTALSSTGTSTNDYFPWLLCGTSITPTKSSV